MFRLMTLYLIISGRGSRLDKKTISFIFAALIIASVTAWGGYVTSGSIKAHNIYEDIKYIKEYINTLALRGKQ